jgi:adenylate cyclase
MATAEPRGESQRLRDGISRRLIRTGWIVNAAGSLVTFMSVGFLIPIFIDPDQRDELALQNGPLVVLAVLIGGLVLLKLMRRDRAIALAWIAEGREPTPEEHRRTLGLPGAAVRKLAAAWAVAGIAFVIYNFVLHSAGFAAVAGATVWLGAETTCGLAYLLFERVLRPVTALALAARLPDEPASPGVRGRLLIAWSLGTGVPVFGVLVVAVVGLTKGNVETDAVAGACIFLGAVALGVGFLATAIAARAIADPVTSVRSALERVAAGDFDTQVTIDDGSEVGLLQAGFNQMAAGLAERERIRDLFGRHVGRDVAQAALGAGARLGGEEREVGALFVDLVGSTSMALAMPPTDVVRLLNRFFRVVVETVEAEGGLVNKFEGDAALCVFGAPARSDNPAAEALRAARRLCVQLEREVPEVGYGIGVSAGVAVAGNVGSEHRFEYTVIGDPINEAARLCELAKERPERVLASETALSRAGEAEAEAWTVGDRTVLRGRLEATGLATPRDEAPAPAT